MENTDEIHLKFEITEDDYVRARRYLASGELRKPTAWPRQRVLGVSVIAALTVLRLLNAADRHAVAIGDLILTGALVGFLVVLVFGDRYTTVWQARQTVGALGPQEVVITPAYLKCSDSGLSASVIRWPALSRLEYLDGDIFYAANAVTIDIIPTSAFASVAESSAVFAKMTGLRNEALANTPAPPSFHESRPVEPQIWPPPPVAPMYDDTLPSVGSHLDEHRSISVEGTLTLDDTLAIVFAQANRMVALSSAVILAIDAVMWLDRPLPFTLVTDGIWLIFCVLLISVLLRSRYSRLVQNNFENVRPSLREFRLSTDFAVVKIETAESVECFAVGNIMRVNGYKTCVGFQLRPAIQRAIPRRAFGTLAESRDFERRLRDAVKAAKAAKKATGVAAAGAP